MSEEREPLRLKDDPAEAPGLRAMLDAAGGEAADTVMLDRVLAGVLAGGGGGGGGGGSSGGGGASAKIAATLGAGMLGAGAIAWMMSGASVEPPPAAPPASAVSIVVDASDVGDAFVEADARVASDAGVDAFVVVVRVDRHPAPPTETETDSALLLRATHEHDPSSSLTLARLHATRFPGSALAEDRDALIVLDLARLNRAAEANAAAAAFRARWPRSAHLPHIDATLARMTLPETRGEP